MTLPQLIGARVAGEYRLWLSYDDGRQGEQAFVNRHLLTAPAAGCEMRPMAFDQRRRLLRETVVPLLLGALIYALRYSSAALPSVLLWSGPGLLWSYATVAWVAGAWVGSSDRERHVWIAAAFLFGPAWEVGQHLQWVAGTYDPVDVALNAVGGAVALIVRRIVA